MYAEAGLQLPVFSQGFLQEVAGGGYQGPYSHLPLSDDQSLLNFHVGIADDGLDLMNEEKEIKNCDSYQREFMQRKMTVMDLLDGNMVQTPTVTEYDMGGEGDLFKAPEAILEEPPALELHIAAAMSILSTESGDVITEPMKVSDMESIQNEHLDSVIYECKKDLLEESEIEDSITELLRVNIPAIQIDEVPSLEKLEGSIQKSVSSGSLNSVELIHSSTMRPDQFFDLQGLDLAAAYSLRRAYSDGDIQSLGNKSTGTGNAVAVCSSFEQLLTISDLKTEQRQQKLSRYREKKSKRNFRRKIKYACRKALADSQPRVRGRFAKTEECESLRPNMRMK